MKKICKGKKLGPYQTITTEQRKRVINLIQAFNLPIKEAAQFVGIHPQTAKNFYAIFLKEGRIGKKQKRDKHSNGISFNSTCIELSREKIQQQQIEIPNWLPFINENEKKITPESFVEIPVGRFSDQEKTTPVQQKYETKEHIGFRNSFKNKMLKDLAVVAWANQVQKAQEALKSIQIFNLFNNIQLTQSH